MQNDTDIQETDEAVELDWVADEGAEDVGQGKTAEAAEDAEKEEVDSASQMVEDVPGFEPIFTKRQTMARKTLQRDDVKEVLYGGAKGGGKSVFGCLWCFARAIEITRD